MTISLPPEHRTMFNPRPGQKIRAGFPSDAVGRFSCVSVSFCVPGCVSRHPCPLVCVLVCVCTSTYVSCACDCARPSDPARTRPGAARSGPVFSWSRFCPCCVPEECPFLPASAGGVARHDVGLWRHGTTAPAPAPAPADRSSPLPAALSRTTSHALSFPSAYGHTNIKNKKGSDGPV